MTTTSTRTVDAMPVYVGRQATRANPRGADFAGPFDRIEPTGRARPPTRQLADRLGIALPADALELYDHALETLTQKQQPTTTLATVTARLGHQVAAGDLDPGAAEAELDEARAALGDDDGAAARRDRGAMIDAAAQKLFVTACRALADGAPTIIDALRDRLADTIARQSKSKSRHPDLDLSERYTLIHRLASALRWATGDVEGAGADFWAFAEPRGPWAWRLEQLDGRYLRQHPKASVQIVATGPVRSDGREVRYVVANGAPPLDLRTIAEHADEWGPGVILADEVLANAERIEHEQVD